MFNLKLNDIWNTKISTDEHDDDDDDDEHDENLYKAKPTAPALMEQDTYTGWGSITFKGQCEPFRYATTS